MLMKQANVCLGVREQALLLKNIFIPFDSFDVSLSDFFFIYCLCSCLIVVPFRFIFFIS